MFSLIDMLIQAYYCTSQPFKSDEAFTLFALGRAIELQHKRASMLTSVYSTEDIMSVDRSLETYLSIGRICPNFWRYIALPAIKCD